MNHCHWFSFRDSALLKDTGLWFWIKEANGAIRHARNSYRHEEFVLVLLYIMTPFVLVLSPIIALPFKYSAVNSINKGQGLTLFNKKNIEYFRVWHTLKNGT